MLLYNLDLSVSIDGGFPDVQAAHSIGTNAPPPSEMQASELWADNKLDGLYSLSFF